MAQNISKANLQAALLKNNIKLKEYINNSISAINQFNVVILTDSNLPTDDIKERTIYMLPDPSSTEENNIYIEYLYINNKWECFGKANNINISDYYTKEEMDSKLINATTTEYGFVKYDGKTIQKNETGNLFVNVDNLEYAEISDNEIESMVNEIWNKNDNSDNN